MSELKKRIPVILDTDIAGDIDDTWALAMLLKCPELDLKLVTTCTGNTTYRAKVAARLLEVAKRTDVPVGIGIHEKDELGPQRQWVEDYDLAKYPGVVHKDGVGALIDAIMNSKEQVTLIGIGPCPNIAAALDRQPAIASKARFVGMYGNIRKPYGDAKVAIPEYNVKQNVAASRKVFTAGWDMTITPLDTCGFVRLTGEKYAKVRDSRDPVAAATIENYRIWAGNHKRDGQTQSSILFDTVAVYLAFADDLLQMEELPLIVEDDGLTAVVPGKGKKIRVATEWKNYGAFEDLLVDRLINYPVTAP